MPAFIPGLKLSQRFYEEAVQPLLAEYFPTLRYAAGLIGRGSEVLGFDTAMSTDHDWGPRCFIFLDDEDEQQVEPIRELLSYYLPREFLGYSTHFGYYPDEPTTRVMTHSIQGPIDHRVIPITLSAFLRMQLGYDGVQLYRAADWLAISSASLREFTAGAVFRDDSGQLTALRERFSWYPRDIWLFLLASGWQRISQEEHLMPRAGFVEDELGSAIMGSRLVRDVMFLGFLMEQQYAPYPKWYGTAFKQLTCSAQLGPLLWKAQLAPTWQEREAALGQAYEVLARMHNALHITSALPEKVTYFFDRPFHVIWGETFARAIVQHISDPDVAAIAARRLIGNIDQWSDSTDLHGLEHARVRKLYE